MRPINHSESVKHLSNDDLTRLTIYRMHQLVENDWQSPIVIDAVRDAIGWDGNRDRKVLVDRVFRWIKRNIKYVIDPYLIVGWYRSWKDAMDCEVLVSPSRLLMMGKPQGDCDDFAMIGKAMLKVCGVESCFVTVKANPHYEDDWSHVYLDVVMGERWVPFDAAYGKYFGWETQEYYERKRWEI